MNGYYFKKPLTANIREFKGYVTRDDSQRPFLAQHSVAKLLRHCFEWLQHCSNIATLCCANQSSLGIVPCNITLSNHDNAGSDWTKFILCVHVPHKTQDKTSHWEIHIVLSSETKRVLPVKCCYVLFSLLKGDITRNDSQRPLLAQHSVATLLRYCFEQ